jgi:hypothetical protein
MSRRRGTFLLVSAVVGLALASSLPSQAADSLAVCTFEANVHIDPGTSLTAASGTFTTRDAEGSLETGRIDCTGRINGVDIVGPGSIGYEGTFGDGPLGADDCVHGNGSGTVAYTLPNSESTMSFSGTFDYVRAAVGGAFSGTVDYGSIAGSFLFQPGEGQDCAQTPVTEAKITGVAVIAGTG